MEDDAGVSGEASLWRFGLTDVLGVVLLAIVGALLWLPGLGTRGLWTSGEARAAQVARRMVATGDYVTQRTQTFEPRLTVVGPEGEEATRYDPNGTTVVYEDEWRQTVLCEMSKGPLRPELQYEELISIHKPILYYWLIALAHRAGMPIDSFTVRCFSAIPAMCLLGVTYLLGCVLYGRRVGAVSALVLATCVQFYWQARTCQMDMLLALMITSVFLLWYVGDRTDRRSIRFLSFLGVYVLLAAASLLKSFAYMLLAGLTVMVYLAVETVLLNDWRQWWGVYFGRLWRVMRRMHIFGGGVLYLALVVPWFVLIHQATDGQYTRGMFLRHMFARAGLMDYGRDFEDSTEWWFYLVRIWVDLFPWVIMIPGAVVQVFRRRCRDTWRQSTYLMAWIIVWFVFFSAMHYRKNEYILPLYPAAMLLVGKMLVDFLRDQATDVRLARAIRSAFVGLAMAVMAAGGFALGLMREDFRTRVLDKLGTNLNDAVALTTIANTFRDHLALTISGLSLLAAGMVAAAILAHRRRAGAALVLLGAGTAFALLVGVHVLTDRLIDPYRTQAGFAQRIQPVVNRLDDHERIILFATEQHQLVDLLPNRFDSVPGIGDTANIGKLFALRSRLAAATKPTFVVMTCEHWDAITGSMRVMQLTDPYIDRLSKVSLAEQEDYVRTHGEPLLLLRFDPADATTPSASG